MAAGLMRVGIALLVATVVLTGCPASQDEPADTGASAMPEWTDKRWHLVSVQGESAVGTPWIRFREPDRVDGSGGCNTFSGSYQQQGESLEIQRLAMTKRHCPDSKLMEQERALLDSLQAVNSLAIEGQDLVLTGTEGRRLEFSATENHPAEAKSAACEINPPKEQIYCTQQYDPVCGCNGKTYGNACTARAAGVPSSRPGRCDDSEPEA